MSPLHMAPTDSDIPEHVDDTNTWAVLVHPRRIYAHSYSSDKTLASVMLTAAVAESMPEDYSADFLELAAEYLKECDDEQHWHSFWVWLDEVVSDKPSWRDAHVDLPDQI